MQKNCPICGTKTKNITQVFDDRYGYPGLYQMTQCTSCRHRLLNVDFTSEELSNLYSNFYPRSSFDLESFQPYQEIIGFKSWLNGLKSSPFRWVPSNVRVLDIGCGFGESLGYYQARGCDVYGVEADENVRRVAKKFGYKVHVGLFDPEVYERDYFEFVTMSQVIEHVADPLEVLRGVRRILKPGGELVLSTPNANGWGARLFGDKWINWHAPYHLHFFSDRSLRRAAEMAGLIVERKRTITPSAWLHYQWIHLLTYPGQGKCSIFWAAANNWTKKQMIVLHLLNLINKVGINHLVTRVFDSLGWGDNSLYFLRKP